MVLNGTMQLEIEPFDSLLSEIEIDAYHFKNVPPESAFNSGRGLDG